MLIRHAKSSWDDPLLDDHDRRLNDRGNRDAPKIGHWIAQLAKPDLVLCSDARRTRETWNHIADALPLTTVDYRADLYLASAQRLDRAIAAATVDTLAIVAHNPGIGDLANRYGTSMHPRFADFPTGAVAVFDLGGRRPVLTAFTTPHDLPD